MAKADVYGVTALCEQLVAEGWSFQLGEWQFSYLADSLATRLEEHIRQALGREAALHREPLPDAWSVGGLGNRLEPCRDTTMFWDDRWPGDTLPGGYAVAYPARIGDYLRTSTTFGACNWWVEVNHPYTPDVGWGDRIPRSTTPAVGAAMYFEPHEQGAGPDGHYAQCVGIAPDNYWLLVSETNAHGGQGGWSKISYRYAHVSPRLHFFYDGAYEVLGQAAVEAAKQAFREEQRQVRRYAALRQQPFPRRLFGEVKGLITGSY